MSRVLKGNKPIKGKGKGKSRTVNEWAKGSTPKSKQQLAKGYAEFRAKRRASSLATNKFLEGTISVNARGFGFLEMGEEDDIFIPARSVGKALHGDRVVVQIQSDGCGEVTKILERVKDRLVGTFYRREGRCFVNPDDSRYPDITVQEQHCNGVKSGCKVVALITSYGERGRLSGKIIEVLGFASDAGVDILSIIRSHGLREEFPAKCEREAESVPTEVESLAGRQDFRDRLIITIDGEDAKDLDDAISLTVTEEGYELGVYIADVAHYVQAGTAIDIEASTRTTSVYFPDRVLPMLPKQLSNGICSLHSGVDRLVLSCLMSINKKGAVTKTRIVEGVINSAERMTYTDCNALLGKSCSAELQQRYAHILPMLKDMEVLASKLNKRRMARGSIDFDLPEAKIVLNEAGQTVDVYAYERGVSNKMIEEFMLIANESVAEFSAELCIPFVYRVHEQPDADKVENLIGFLEALGEVVTFGREVSPKAMQSMLSSIKGKDYYSAASRVSLRTMQKARYATQCLGHFGLGAEYYCHFTSPIRRYPDLSIHRVLKFLISEGAECVKSGKASDELRAVAKRASMFEVFCTESAEQSSKKEKSAEEAERQVDDLKKAEYMQAFIGETFNGVICGVTEFGLFVELPNTVEGLIKIESLGNDNYFFDELHYCLKGRSAVYKLGDSVCVKVAGVNMGMRRVEFELG